MAPCNCGGKTRPMGSKSAQNRPAPATTNKTTQPPAKGQTQSFVFTSPDNQNHKYGSRLEAEAARARMGGGSVKPV